MKDACPKTVTADAPISHRRVDIGDAKNPNGRATNKTAVYSWFVFNVPKGVTRSWPFNLLIPAKLKNTNTITNRSNGFVKRV